MMGGWLFALVFFALMFFAALSSAIALLECVISAVLDHFHCSRTKVPSALSAGPFAHITILNYSLFDFMCMLTDNILMPVGGILLCVFVGWIWGPRHIVEHIESEGVAFRLQKAWILCIRYITPVLVVIVTVVGFVDIYKMIVG